MSSSPYTDVIGSTAQTVEEFGRMKQRYANPSESYFEQVVGKLNYLLEKRQTVECKLKKFKGGKSVRNKKYAKLVKYEFTVNRAIKNVGDTITQDEQFYHRDKHLSTHTFENASKWVELINALTIHYFITSP